MKKKNKNGRIVGPQGIVPGLLQEAMSPFGLPNINGINWERVTQCIELLQIGNINETDLLNRFTEIQMLFKSVQDEEIPLYDQV